MSLVKQVIVKTFYQLVNQHVSESLSHTKSKRRLLTNQVFRAQRQIYTLVWRNFSSKGWRRPCTERLTSGKTELNRFPHILTRSIAGTKTLRFQKLRDLGPPISSRICTFHKPASSLIIFRVLHLPRVPSSARGIMVAKVRWLVWQVLSLVVERQAVTVQQLKKLLKLIAPSAMRRCTVSTIAGSKSKLTAYVQQSNSKRKRCKLGAVLFNMRLNTTWVQQTQLQFVNRCLSESGGTDSIQNSTVLENFVWQN